MGRTHIERTEIANQRTICRRSEITSGADPGLCNPVCRTFCLQLEASQRRGEVAAELFGEIDGNTGMDSALTVEEFRLVI